MSKHPQPPADDESAFLAAYDAAEFPHPSVTVDVALMTVAERRLRVLLLRRENAPQRGRWALAGSFVGMRETLDEAAARVAAAKLGLERIFLEQLYTFGAVARDPRTRVISVAYFALVDAGRLQKAKPARGELALCALDVPWEGESGGAVRVLDEEGAALPLAFDHAEMLGLVVKRLRGKLDYAPIGFQFLPQRFTLRELQEVHEAVLGTELNKDSFRRSVLARGLVTATGAFEKDVPYRPAELYRYAKKSQD